MITRTVSRTWAGFYTFPTFLHFLGVRMSQCEDPARSKRRSSRRPRSREAIVRPPIPPARHLLSMLERKSNFQNGRVWYGRAITYAKIAGWFKDGGDEISLVTLRRWM